MLDSVHQGECRLDRSGLKEVYFCTYSCGMSRSFRPYWLPRRPAHPARWIVNSSSFVVNRCDRNVGVSELLRSVRVCERYSTSAS